MIALAIPAGAVLAAGTVAVTMAAQEESVAMTFGKSRKYMDYKNGVFKVRAGGGGPTAPLTAFFPQVAHIKVGESVVWHNPSNVGEPHTFTFITDGQYGANIEAPFAAKNVEGFEPVTFPDPEGKTVIAAANARSLMPTAISTDGTAVYMPPNAAYTMDGTEKYVNSGWIWPAGMTPPGLPEISTFTLTFDEPGTYDYVCAIHPWQAGRVVVE